MSTRVLLADDSDLMREPMRRILEDERQIELIGEACSFGQAIQMIADFKPEVLLLDLHLAEKESIIIMFGSFPSLGRQQPQFTWSEERHCYEIKWFGAD